jgi:hypothetical protein
MNGLDKDSFLRLAREAGLPVSDKFDGIGYVWCSDEYPIDEPLQRFANLVAAAERNRTWTQDHWTEYEHSIAAAEREACAKLCDALKNPIDDPLAPVGQYESGGYITAEFLADAIRARGNDAA